MFECSWRAFGELFGRHLSSLGIHLESLGLSKAGLGSLLEIIGRILEPEEAELAAQSALGNPIWNSKALKMPSWRSKAGLRAQLGGPNAFRGLSEGPLRAPRR